MTLIDLVIKELEKKYGTLSSEGLYKIISHQHEILTEKELSKAVNKAEKYINANKHLILED